MVEHQTQARITLGDLVGQMHVLVMEQDHRRDTGLLHLAPYPIEPAVDQRLAQDVRVEGEAHAEHAGLLIPVGDLIAGTRRIGIEAPHDGEAIRVGRGRLEGKVVAVAFPRGRHQDHPIDARLVHLGQQLVLAERRPMRLGPGRPRPLGRVGGPDVDLRIDDHHAAFPNSPVATATPVARRLQSATCRSPRTYRPPARRPPPACGSRPP